jgi:hypothetical protein
MAHRPTDIEEHELPSIEAVLAGTLALMTGYSQALQAELDPQHRVKMGSKIGDNLSLLVDHPQLSLGFRQVLLGLQGRWRAMGECTTRCRAGLRLQRRRPGGGASPRCGVALSCRRAEAAAMKGWLRAAASSPPRKQRAARPASLRACACGC